MAVQLVEPEELVRRVAAILGPSSAAAKALAELERRRASGEDAIILKDDRLWIVGRRPTNPGASNG